MKRFLVLNIMLVMALFAYSQQGTTPTEPPFKRFPTVPPLKLLRTDSATIYSKKDIPKKKPVMIIVFSPDCDHCQHEAKDIMAHIDQLKDILIIFCSPAKLYTINQFANTYGLTKNKNIIVGQDFSYLLTSFYGMRNFPFIACYDKKQQLITSFDGSFPIEKVLKHFE